MFSGSKAQALYKLLLLLPSESPGKSRDKGALGFRNGTGISREIGASKQAILGFFSANVTGQLNARLLRGTVLGIVLHPHSTRLTRPNTSSCHAAIQLQQLAYLDELNQVVCCITFSNMSSWCLVSQATTAEKHWIIIKTWCGTRSLKSRLPASQDHIRFPVGAMRKKSFRVWHASRKSARRGQAESQVWTAPQWLIIYFCLPSHSGSGSQLHVKKHCRCAKKKQKKKNTKQKKQSGGAPTEMIQCRRKAGLFTFLAGTSFLG